MARNVKRVRIEEVARAAGVGTTTVSRVINNRSDVGARTKARVEATIRRLGYVPSAAARRMAGDQPHTTAPRRLPLL